MSLEFSKYQVAVFEEIKKGEKNLTIQAVAGSGKSTTIVNALRYIPSNSSALFLAFNKAIVEELQIKLKDLPNVNVKTLHSIGLSALIKTYRCKINNWKYKKFINDSLFLLTKELTIDSNEHDIVDYKYRVYKLIDLARFYLAKTKEDVEKIAEKHNISCDLDEAEVVLKVLDWGAKRFKEVDFADMIWLPVVKDLKVEQYDWVFIDEAQDLNSCQLQLFLKFLKPNGHFVAVGDRKQSINGFVGADQEVFNKLLSIPNTIELPLSICYRCAKKIVEKAQIFVPYIEYAEDAIDGEINHVKDLKNVQPGDLVLCRVSAPLASVCMKFIMAGKPAYVKGRDIGEGLINVVKRTKTDDLTVMFEILGNELYKIAMKISKKQNVSFEEAKNDYAYIAMEDKIECLKELSRGCSDVKCLIQKLQLLFKDDAKNSICLSTVHKAKGLGANNLYIVAPEKLPLKRCMNVDWQAEQERNLTYVCITRAKQTLNYVDCDFDKIEV